MSENDKKSENDINHYIIVYKAFIICINELYYKQVVCVYIM